MDYKHGFRWGSRFTDRFEAFRGGSGSFQGKGAAREETRRRSPLRARRRARGQRFRAERFTSGRGLRRGSRGVLHRRCRGRVVFLAGARSAAAAGCRGCAFSLRLDGRATAAIAAMACARWTKNTPALFARANSSDGVSKPPAARARRASHNRGSGSPGGCETLHPSRRSTNGRTLLRAGS